MYSKLTYLKELNDVIDDINEDDANNNYENDI